MVPGTDSREAPRDAPRRPRPHTHRRSDTAPPRALSRAFRTAVPVSAAVRAGETGEVAVEMLVDRLVRDSDQVSAAVLDAVLAAVPARCGRPASISAAHHVERLVPVVLDRVRAGGALGAAEDGVLRTAGRDMALRGVPLAVGAASLREAIEAFGRMVLVRAEPDLHLAAVTVLDRATQLSYEVALAMAAGYSPEEDGRPALPTVARRVLELAAEGHSSKRIADELHYSEQTVTYHLGRLMREFGVPNRTALIAVAVRRGLIHVEAWSRPAVRP